jgi:hypothetical protein
MQLAWRGKQQSKLKEQVFHWIILGLEQHSLQCWWRIRAPLDAMTMTHEG